MTNENDGSNNGSDAAIGAPSVGKSEPKDPVPPKPATTADLAEMKTEIKKEMSSFERATLRWTRASFLVVLATGVFICLQWREMRTGGVDTHTLADAAKKQADKSETISASIASAANALDTSNRQAKDALDTTVKENRKALNATLAQNQKALGANIAASQSEQRAYVTIGRPDGTVADILWPKDDKGNAGLVVYFQNNGRLPARFNWGATSPTLEVLPTDPTIVRYEDWKGGYTELPTNHLFQPMFRAKSKDGKHVNWSGTIDIAGGSSYEGVLWEIPKERLQQLIRFENRPFLPSGRFEYCDGFGNRVCREFSLSYAKEPYSRFFLLSEGECSDYEMQIRHPLPDFDYLPVCEVSRPELRRTLPTFPKPK